MGKRKNTRVQFGEQLRSARVAQHLSIDQVAADLRIPARHLDALEQSDVSTFSAPVYAHGALRSYAGYLGLRADTLERALSSELKTFANQTDLKVHTLPRWHQRILSGTFVLWLAGGLVAGVIGSYVFWQIGSFWRLPRIVITSPQYDVVEQSSVLLAGKTEADVRLRINGEPVMLRSDNTFEQEIPLLPGVTVLQIEGENAAGRVRIVEKHLFRSRDGIASEVLGE